MRNPCFVVAGVFALFVITGCAKHDDSNPLPVSTPTEAPAKVVGPGVTTPKFPEHVYWGDTHVHTGWSADAGLGGATLSPEDAVRFARGQLVKSTSGLEAQLRRPLDWIAVTDQSDGMGTMNELRAGNAEFMADATAKRWYGMMNKGGEAGQRAQMEVVSAQASKALPKVFMDSKWMVSAWEKTVDVMEKYYEPGQFTTFIAYEWSSNGENGQKIHRNVIFRDGADKTRATPPLTTFQSAAPGRSGADPESLWQWLTDWEAMTGGQVLAIPHNATMSNGGMFREARYDGTPLTEQWAAARAKWEPLVEVYQYDGFSEAHPKLSPTDEFLGDSIGGTANAHGVVQQPDDKEHEYARGALQIGLQLQNQFGINPFRFGMVSGSDTQNGLSATDEDNYYGTFVGTEPSPHRWNHDFKKVDADVRKGWTLTAAGLTGVWATANTREAIWDALQRRETYASTGPRIAIRFFAGFDFVDGDDGPEMVATGYAKGVPMGGDLKKAPVGKTPTFLIIAMKDPNGANLDRVQIIKGWVDAKGDAHEKIYDVLWSDNRKPDSDGRLPQVGNTVDVVKATYTNSIGAKELRGVFKDTQFNAKQGAFYYARVIEIPTPRWTNYDAVKFKLKMDKEVPMVIQERAVTSPVWYEP